MPLKVDGRISRAQQLRESRRTAVLAVARRIFSQKGYHATSINDLIEGADIARGTFYLYFESKRAIFDELAFAARALETARGLPATFATLRGRLKERAPILFAQAREEWVDAKPVVVEKLRAKFTPERAKRARPSTERRGSAAPASI